jgi:hypothetical protein
MDKNTMIVAVVGIVALMSVVSLFILTQDNGADQEYQHIVDSTADLVVTTSILSSVSPADFDCVDNPLTELSTTMTKAKAGSEETTKTLCFKNGEGMGISALKNRVSGVTISEFECVEGANVCKENGGFLRVTRDEIRAEGGDAKFSARILCYSVGVSNYSCRVIIADN